MPLDSGRVWHISTNYKWRQWYSFEVSQLVFEHLIALIILRLHYSTYNFQNMLYASSHYDMPPPRPASGDTIYVMYAYG